MSEFDYITSQQVSIGKQINPIHRIKLMSPEEWEMLTEEWLDIKTGYHSIEQIGGAGDLGRDVIAYIDNPKDNPENYQWDCYQCKHYNKPLSPSDIWTEFGKIIYYTFMNEFPIPNNYYFVAPQGIGSSLSSLLKDAVKLKESIRNAWEKYCQDEITKTESIPLVNDLLVYFNQFDFSIFDKIVPKIIVEEHKKHHNHLPRFGGGLPSRTSIEIPSVDIDKKLRYVEQLVKAYDSDSVDSINTVEHIEDSKYHRHFKDSRKSFYKAEELRALTRDNLKEQVFKDFKEDIFDGIINKAEEDFDNGYKKAKEVESEASKIIIDSNPLTETCRPVDKKGVCHHLVNDKKISWIG
ncbi:ABC-three component system protein [Malaciobacter marinus]|uniref:ABC-three component system protein n=1 Tax=Malaciobacter marinus TaxID=505249 RepID=UPI003B00925C